MIRTTHAYDPHVDGHLTFISQYDEPAKITVPWFHVGSYGLTLLVAAALWIFFIAPDEKSPRKLMVQPATEELSTFIQPTVDIPSLSGDVGFNVHVPNLKRLGVELKAVGESDFGGQHAAVMQYQYGGSEILLYSFSKTGDLLRKMRHVVSEQRHFYVTSDGAVSVVAWQGQDAGFHALAAKSTESDLVDLASNVASVS